MLKTRLVTSLVAVPVVAVAIWSGGYLFSLVVLFLALAGVLEFYRLAGNLNIKPLVVFGAIWTAFVIAARYPGVEGVLSNVRPVLGIYTSPDKSLSAVITLGVVVSLLVLLFRREKSGAFLAWAWTWAGILYVGWLLGHLVALRGLSAGRNWVFYAVLCTFGSDTAAYLAGKAFGRRKLAPRISPGKTWEGSLGGLLGAVAVSLLFLLPTPLSLAARLSLWQAVVLGLLVSIAGQLGDLIESLLKRSAGVKDSGWLFPGHGGVLDRTDSISFAGLMVYYWVTWLVMLL